MQFTKKIYWMSFAGRVIVLTLFSALINFLINSVAFSQWLRNNIALGFAGMTSGEVDYLIFVIQSLCSGLLLLTLVMCVIWLEQPSDIRQFFKVGPIDLKGLGLIALFVAILDVLEIGFLRRSIYEPVRLFLTSFGLPGKPSLDVPFAPDPHLVGINIVLLLLIFWIEAPEEVFFRGYVQNHLQEYVHPNIALFLGAFTWTFWHFFALADFLRILILGVAFSLVFRLRQNTTPLAIWHPLSNRLLILFSLITVWLTHGK
jgi:membrane protease YdiL (CAAX protease family)